MSLLLVIMKGKNFYTFHSQLSLPFLATNNEHFIDIFKVLELKFGLKSKSHQKLIDLGSGDGRVVIYAALNYGIKSLGVEINSNLIKDARDQLKLLKKEKNYTKKQIIKIKFKLGDFFELNLKKFDYIYIYCLPTMQKYLKHVFITAKRGAIIISYKYPLKSFELFLNLEHKLEHKEKNQALYTYYYRRF